MTDMSAGADLTGVDSPDGGTRSCTFAPEVEAVTSPAPQPLHEGPDLTVEGPCTQQPEPVEYPDLDEYRDASFAHAESHYAAATDPEWCDDNDCPHWPSWWADASALSRAG